MPVAVVRAARMPSYRTLPCGVHQASPWPAPWPCPGHSQGGSPHQTMYNISSVLAAQAHVRVQYRGVQRQGDISPATSAHTIPPCLPC